MIADVLQHLVPKARFVLHGEPVSEDEYLAGMTWLDDRPQPSWAEVVAARGEVERGLRNLKIRARRQSAYAREADPLFFKWQRGGGTEQEWLAKVAEIEARFPYA